ncbi:hypothetical protein V8E53_009202 [Lactarius tabidus]
MPHAPPPLRQRQSNAVPAVPSASGLTGGTTASSVNLDSSSLLLNPTSLPVPSVTNSLAPNVPVITITDSTSHQTTSPTSSSSAALHTGSPLSTGAVLGISVAVFVVAIAAMLAVYTLFKRRTYARARQPPPRGSPPTSRVEGGNRGGGGGGDKWKRLEGDKPSTREAIPPAPPKTPEIGRFELFEKDPSVRTVSDEKANHSFDPATMPNFVQYHPDLAGDLSTPSRPFATGAGAEGSHVLSWGGDTAADSFLSLRTSGSMSPSAVVTRQTPMTTDSAQHRWESAEVLIMDEAATERPSVYSEMTHNPFRDDASRTSFDGNEVDTRASSSNPFFNASQAQHDPFSDRSSRSRKSSVSTVKRSRSNSLASRGTVRAGDNALLSLIAALDTRPVPTEDQSIRTSMQTTSTSIYSASIVPPTPKAF